MARIRTIKPDFFRHEGLQDLEAAKPGLYTMMVFAGLWGHCDKAGRFEWKPRTLKLDILPFLTFDMSAAMEALEQAGFIRRYDVAGKTYGEIPAFEKHQRINGKEAQEPEKHPAPTVKQPDQPAEKQGSAGEAPGKQLPAQEGKGREEEGKKEEEAGKGTENPIVGLSASVGQTQPDPVLTIFGYWQDRMCSPKSKLDDRRKRLIAKALDHYSPADICRAIRGCSRTPHNMGQNDRNTKYNGLNLILRDAEHIDYFIACDDGQPKSGKESVDEMNARITAEFLADGQDDGNVIEMETS